jgi:hypothetical protein
VGERFKSMKGGVWWRPLLEKREKGRTRHFTSNLVVSAIGLFRLVFFDCSWEVLHER